jgi:hypothetical protein
MRRAILVLLVTASCGSSVSSAVDSAAGAALPDSGTNNPPPIVIDQGETRYFGDPHSGNFWLGPVDYSESKFNNACGPAQGTYPPFFQQLYGSYLMGLANEAKLQALVAGNGQLCDVCAELVANGVTLVARVVTYGDETGPNDIDVSPEARAALAGDTNHTCVWRFVTCPTKNPIYYTFDDREWSNTWYFRLWVRNARVPVAEVEYRLGSGAWAKLSGQSDGAWEADSRDFSAGFTVRVTSIEGKTVEDAIPGIGTFDPNQGVASHANFE